MKDDLTPTALAIATVAAHFVVAGDSMIDATNKAAHLIGFAREKELQMQADHDFLEETRATMKDLTDACDFLAVKQPRTVQRYLADLWSIRISDDLPRMERSLARFWARAVAGEKVFSLEILGALRALKEQALSERNAKVAASRRIRASKKK